MSVSVFPGPASRRLFSIVLLITLNLLRVFCPAQETPENFNDLARRAADARDRQDLPLAIQLYSKAVQLKPDWQQGWWDLGLLLYSSNQYPGAIDAFNHLFKSVPASGPAMALRGLCEFETGAYDDSMRDLEQALAHGAANEPPKEQIIRFHLAELFTRARLFEDALEQYRLLATQPLAAPDLMIGIGLAGLRVPSLPKDVPEDARNMVEDAGRAGYIFLSGNDLQADDLFSQLFVRYRSSSGLHLFYGLLLFPHAPGMAANQFRSELSSDPSNETANALLALALVVDGRFSEALQPAQRAYDAAPDMTMAQLVLGRALAETGEAKRSAELLNRVLERDPDNLEAHLGLLSIYSRSGNREETDHEREICRELAR